MGWTPPGGRKSEVLASGETWMDLAGRLEVIQRQVLPRFDI